MLGKALRYSDGLNLNGETKLRQLLLKVSVESGPLVVANKIGNSCR